jgi:hypothetical protein
MPRLEGFVAHIKHTDLASFGEDKVNLKKTEVNRQRAKVNDLRDRIEREIKDTPGFGLVKALHAGSVAKGTATSRGSDRDLAVYVEAEKAPSDTPGLVVWVRDRVSAACSGMDDVTVTANTNCVEVILSGGLKVDVVPVLYEGEPNDIGYLVRKHSGRRLKTSVRQHLDFIRRRKKLHPELAQLIRFTKWWVHQVRDRDPDFKCKSFMLELIWVYLADNKRINMDDHVLALEGFFAFVAHGGFNEQIAFTDFLPSSQLPARGDKPIQVLDPVNFDNNVAERYEQADRTALETAAARAYDTISTAHYEPVPDGAEALWQTIMGRTFRRAS